MMALGNKGSIGDMGKGWLPPGKTGDGSTDMGNIGKGDMGKGWLPPGQTGDGSTDMGNIGKGDMGKGWLPPGNTGDDSSDGGAMAAQSNLGDMGGRSFEDGPGGGVGEGEPPAKMQKTE